MAKSQKTSKPVVKSFSAPLEHLRSGLGWVVAYLPFDAASVWGSRGRPKVKGEINGFAFRTSLFPTRDGRHFLLINKRMQKGGRAIVGAIARFRLEPDTEERTVTIPAELKRVLAEALLAMVRQAELLNPQMDCRLDYRREKRRSPGTPVRAGSRAVDVHNGSRTRPAAHAPTRIRPHTPRP
jgi:hypothetical protein